MEVDMFLSTILKTYYPLLKVLLRGYYSAFINYK